MYVCSSRSAKSCTNSSRSVGVRCCQWGPSARRAVSCTSKASAASLRTARRRPGRPAPGLTGRRSSILRAGSCSTFCTASVYSRNVSVGDAAHAGPTRPSRSASVTRILAVLIRGAPSGPEYTVHRRSGRRSARPARDFRRGLRELPNETLQVAEHFQLEQLQALPEGVAEVGVAILLALEGPEVGDDAWKAVARDEVVGHQEGELVGRQRPLAQVAHGEPARVAERLQIQPPRGHARV